jgi:hypothetical protein
MRRSAALSRTGSSALRRILSSPASCRDRRKIAIGTAPFTSPSRQSASNCAVSPA